MKASMAGAAGKPDRNIPEGWQQSMDFDYNMQRQRELAAAGNIKLSRAFQPIHTQKWHQVITQPSPAREGCSRQAIRSQPSSAGGGCSRTGVSLQSCKKSQVR